jgi:hypothetical protein
VPDNNPNSNQSGEEEEAAENIIVIYDDTTSDEQDLLVDSNPLKIVQENIKKAGFQKECKILKGMRMKIVASCYILLGEKFESIFSGRKFKNQSYSKTKGNIY